MKQLLVILCLMGFLNYSGNCQLSNSDAKEITTFLNTHIVYPRALIAKRMMPTTLVRISLSKQGTIDSIRYTASTPKEVEKEVTRVVELTKNNLFYKSYKNKTLIIPVFFFLYSDDKIDFNYADILNLQMNTLFENKLYDARLYVYLPPVVIKTITSTQVRF